MKIKFNSNAIRGHKVVYFDIFFFSTIKRIILAPFCTRYIHIWIFFAGTEVRCCTGGQVFLLETVYTIILQH